MYIYSYSVKVRIKFYLNNIISNYFTEIVTFTDLDFNKLLNIFTSRFGIFNYIRININRNLLNFSPIETNKRELYVKIDSKYTHNKFIPFIIYCLPILCSQENLKLTYLQLYYPIPKKINDISLYNTNNLIHIFFILGQRDNNKEIISYTTLSNYLEKIKHELRIKKKQLQELSKNIPSSIIKENIIPFIYLKKIIYILFN